MKQMRQIFTDKTASRIQEYETHNGKGTQAKRIFTDKTASRTRGMEGIQRGQDRRTQFICVHLRATPVIHAGYGFD